MITEEGLYSDYNAIKKAVADAISDKNYERALGFINLAAISAYTYNFLPDFSDRALEKNIEQIAEINFTPVQITGDKDCVLFYDYFGYDNRGLTQQFIRAVMAMGKKLVYLLEENNDHFSSGDIHNELSTYDKVQIYRLTGSSALGKIQEVLDIVTKEKPANILMHLAPWNVVAYAALHLVKGATRYQVNLTDHAFWLGVGITDVCLEFRSYGWALSNQRRKIPQDQLAILPYYPIVNQTPFKGFPEAAKGKKVIFAGANVYKILGEDFTFLKLVKRILDIDPELVFIFAGSGNMTAVNDFIRQHQFEERFLLIGNRDDIAAVLAHSDYSFATYPFTGGLMNQIAAACRVPLFSFTTPEYKCNNISEFYYKISHLEHFDNLENFINRFRQVYKDQIFLKSYGAALGESMITPDEFAMALGKIFEGKNPFAHLINEVDTSNEQKVISSFLIDSENQYDPKYDALIKTRLTASERKKIFPDFFKREQRHNLKHNKVAFLKNYYRILFP